MAFVIALIISLLGVGALAVLFVWCSWRQGWKDEGAVMRREDERHERSRD